MNRFSKITTALTVVALSFSGITARASIVIQPNETASKDVFVYQGLPTTNFEVGFGPLFEGLLTTGKTAAPAAGHDTSSLIQFDLSSVALTGAGVASATLNLYVIPTEDSGFGVSPDAGHPVELDAAALAGTWTESGVTWSTVPATTGSPNSTTISGVNQWISVDVTDIVKGWLDNPASNDGVLLSQPFAVLNPDLANFVAAVYASSSPIDASLDAGFTTTAAERPFLEITAVPEPASAAIFGAGLLLLAARRGRGRVA